MKQSSFIFFFLYTNVPSILNRYVSLPMNIKTDVPCLGDGKNLKHAVTEDKQKLAQV